MSTRTFLALNVDDAVRRGIARLAQQIGAKSHEGEHDDPAPGAAHRIPKILWSQAQAQSRHYFERGPQRPPEKETKTDRHLPYSPDLMARHERG